MNITIETIRNPENMDRRILKQLKDISRKEQLERNKQVGFPRAKTYGGKETSRDERRKNKNKLREYLD